MTELASSETLNDAHPPAGGEPPSPGMVWVAGGTFLMGSDQHYPEEAPARPANTVPARHYPPEPASTTRISTVAMRMPRAA